MLRSAHQTARAYATTSFIRQPFTIESIGGRGGMAAMAGAVAMVGAVATVAAVARVAMAVVVAMEAAV